MEKINFNHGWYLSRTGSESVMESFLTEGGDKEAINLPHDGMIRECRNKETKNGGQTGYYPGGIYTYSKSFDVPKEWQDKNVVIEFEGIQGIAKILVNGDFAGVSYYGYSSTYIDMNDFLDYGDENKIEVIANNEMEQNSRWYTGSGIYRNANLYIGKKIHIPINGLKITTPEVNQKQATVNVKTALKNDGYKKKKVQLLIEIQDEKHQVIATDTFPVTLYGNSSELINQNFYLTNPELWDCENPYLYHCNVSIIEDEVILDSDSSTFGVRKLQLDPLNGLRINGIEVKLRGACLHHDNGIIGASCLPDAERRRFEQLKEAGFNSVRSSHNPMSKTSLQICDELGILVIDELTDVWNQGKNINDYSNFFDKFWEVEVEKMIDKDFNHPCVILYSTGNEIKEAGTSIGAKINRQITNKIHSLDNSRYVTNGINGILATGDRFKEIIFNIMEEQEINLPMNSTSDEAKDGSNDINSMQAVLVGDFADAIATHPIMDEMLEEFTDGMDIAGYNYLTGRHVIEREKYPNRTVLGMETFPADIANLWEIVKNNNHVIGDFTWTGYDYLGEAGVGVFHYDGRINFQPQYPDRTAYIGDIDIIGNRRPISYYREIVYGLRKTPYIAVERVNRYGQESSKTPWMWKDVISSWTWPGFEGKPAIINVCSDADEIELVLNGKSLGRKSVGSKEDYVAIFEINYEPGELVAISYRDGEKAEQTKLVTANESSQLIVQIDKTTLNANGEDLAYIMVRLADDNGRTNHFDKVNVSIEVEGACSLEGFGSANPSSEGNYFDTTWETYDGSVLAVLRAGTIKGETTVKFTADGYEDQEVIITAE